LLQVIKESEKEQVLSSVHDDSTSGGHFAWEKTWHKVKNKYFWKGMSVDIKAYCRSCSKCQRHNKQGTIIPDELHPVPVPSLNMKQVGIDFIGPKNKTKSGMTAILVMTDYKSKWPEVQACPNMEAVTVARFLYRQICRCV